jgi:tetratricopeptide (TPR) repeat protein
MQSLAVLAGVVALWTCVPALAAGPSLAKQQLAYAKEQYAAGVTAMEAKNYTEAVTRFEEAYRYAPDKHAFNFNIGEAALAAGDCAKARSAYESFLRLTPGHPETDTAKQRLARTGSCRGAVDEERPELARREDHAPDIAALLAALQATWHARDQYDRAAKFHPHAKVFASAVRRHDKQARRLVKVLARRGEAPPERTWNAEELPVGGTVPAACTQAITENDAVASSHAAAATHAARGRDGRAVSAGRKLATKFEPQFRFCARP